MSFRLKSIFCQKSRGDKNIFLLCIKFKIRVCFLHNTALPVMWVLAFCSFFFIKSCYMIIENCDVENLCLCLNHKCL
jgi:hypothetical protein